MPFTLDFSQIGLSDIANVGGKNASLGEMTRELTTQGIRVPGGFAVTAEAYQFFLKENGLAETISGILNRYNTQDVSGLQEAGASIRSAFMNAKMPAQLAEAIIAAYQEMGEPDVAVRSSATAEDLPGASFAGQQETYLNIRGSGALVHACQRCFASLYTDRAIHYRENQGYEHLKVHLAIAVQKMVRSDLACSGVMFSIDTESGFKDVILINAAYGLGENVVQGAVNPDEYYVYKPTLEKGFRPILQKRCGSKLIQMVYDEGGGKNVRNIPVAENRQKQLALNDDEILQLAKWAVQIENHYSKKHDHFTPMDMEWAKDGKSGELYIVQARPETVKATQSANIIETFRLKRKGARLIEGRAVGERVGIGRARIIRSTQELSTFQPGEVLIAERTDPDWEPVMKKAAAIVTDTGGRTCHAAIVSREVGVPAVVGCAEATSKIQQGQMLTVSCCEGDVGRVYPEEIPYEVQRIELDKLPELKTRIMMNLANPEQAFHLASLPTAGVGLARMEFVINNYVKIHPMALVQFDSLTDLQAKHQIESLTEQYEDKTEYFVDKLAQGISMIAAAFNPRDVILRMSDFKTNEYANLIGGREFEPEEANPMIGFRGASRYYSPRYAPGFALECQAVQRVRKQMGLLNLKVMIPFCRTIEEGKQVLEVMSENGLQRGDDGLEVYVMCEIPSNVILADQFSEIFDGFSIGSNDLTQLVLGVDRDSETLAHIFDERNAAVKRMIQQVIKTAKSAGRKVGICGQAPSDYPDFAKFLVEQGIDSISLTPDSVPRTLMMLAEQ
ncbi:MAG: phosphoenolpyruvate synthase [Bdellovibrionales bacterium]|nr:phosphoenolpyruvate synthase [Bdellovibrionales bacterium]